MERKTKMWIMAGLVALLVITACGACYGYTGRSAGACAVWDGGQNTETVGDGAAEGTSDDKPLREQMVKFSFVE